MDGRAQRDQLIINAAAFLRSLSVGLMGVVLGIYLSRIGFSTGIDGASHDFRHTYAVELLKSGIKGGIRAVQKALGHASLQVTERYYAKWDKEQQSKLDDALRAALSNSY